MRKLVLSILASVLLLNALFTTDDLTSKHIMIPFLVFSLAFGIRSVLILMNKQTIADKLKRIYTVAFLIYFFGFVIYWDYMHLINGKYIEILFSVPFWIAGVYLIYKRFIKK